MIVIPGLARVTRVREPDCVGGIANANAAGGPTGERQGRREFIGCEAVADWQQTDSGSPLRGARNDENKQRLLTYVANQ